MFLFYLLQNLAYKVGVRVVCISHFSSHIHKRLTGSQSIFLLVVVVAVPNLIISICSTVLKLLLTHQFLHSLQALLFLERKFSMRL